MDELLLVFCYFFQFPTLGTGTVCLFTFGTSAAVFLDRAIQCIYQLLLSSIASIVALFSLLFISVQYFNNGVFIYVCCFDRIGSLLNEMHFHDLNESYDSYELARPGPSLMRCSFTKSNFMLFHEKYHTHYLHSRSTRTTRTTRILAFRTRTSGEYWTCRIKRVSVERGSTVP